MLEAVETGIFFFCGNSKLLNTEFGYTKGDQGSDNGDLWVRMPNGAGQFLTR
jgi:hypothetical protein